jgi:NAD(P)-dependent dehydrogenase (short-subunit alcohol dehydrogenase family)
VSSSLIAIGIGLMIAKGLAENGAIVYILGRRKSKLDEVVQSNHFDVGKLIAVQCDVSSKESLKAAVKQVESDVGYVNLVVANSGISGPNHNDIKPRASNDERGPLTVKDIQDHLWGVNTEDILDVYRVNVVGALDTTIAFLDLLDKGNKQNNVKQSSQVIIISSIGGFHRAWQLAGLPYVTSKAAVNHMIKNLAATLIQFKIRVNGIAPGSMI